MLKVISRTFISLIFVVLASPAFALSLQDAKTQGLVGEQLNGYLGIIKESSDVKALVSNVNKRRKAKYQELAKKNNIDLATVAKLAGNKAISKTKSGNYIQNQSGQWVKK